MKKICEIRISIVLSFWLILAINKSATGQFINETVPMGIESQLIDAQKQELIGNYDKSIELLENMRTIPETRSAVYYQLSRLYKSKGKWEDALNAIQESVNADPNNKWTRVFQANLYEALGKYLLSAQSYEALIKIEPDNYTMYDLAALNYVKAEQISKAILILDHAQTKFGPLPKLAIQKSKLLTLNNKTKRAIEVLLLAHKEYPKNIDIIAELIQTNLEQSDLEEAEKFTKLLQELSPNHPILTARQTESPISIEVASGPVNVDEITDPDPLIKSLIPELKKLNPANKDRLLNTSEKLCLKFPKEPKCFVFKADILYGSDQFLEAAKAYQTATELGTVPYSVWENYLICLIKLTHWKTLEEKTNLALDYYPNQSFLYYGLALAQLNLKKFENSISQIQQFTIMSKNSPARIQEAAILMARVYDEQKKFEQADEFWKKAQLSESNTDLATIEQNYSLAKNGKSINQSRFSKAMNNPELSQEYVLSKKAGVAYFMKDYDKAQLLIIQCLNLSNGRNTDNFNLAYQIYLDSGDKVKAKEFLIKARDVSDDKTYYNHILNTLN
ncbi:MAG: hypothetical protein IT267_09020 [Saprospiraceae bacterium]|nr:hypothetical protein [Saprospiraceae bacterium]